MKAATLSAWPHCAHAPDEKNTVQTWFFLRANRAAAHSFPHFSRAALEKCDETTLSEHPFSE
jgi:hypothetical protein